MITAQDIARALNENIEEIQSELGAEWWRFRSALIPLKQGFVGISDCNALEVAADTVWDILRRYPFVKELVRAYSIRRERILPAGNLRAIEMSTQEIISGFQTLFAKLEKMEPPKQPGRSIGKKPSGTQATHDH